MSLAADFVRPPQAGAPLPPVRILWPDGTAVASDGGDPDTRLSETLGRPVTLTTERPEAPSLERLDPLAEEETIVDIGELMMAGRFSDYAALHLISTATMARLAELRPESAFNARRFRPNVTIATPEGEQGFVENDWVGRELAIGDEVRLRISDPTPRCSVPTLAQQDLAKDPQVLRTIVEHNTLPVPVLDGEALPCAGVLCLRHSGRHGEEGRRGTGCLGRRRYPSRQSAGVRLFNSIGWPWGVWMVASVQSSLRPASSASEPSPLSITSFSSALSQCS